MLSAPPLQLLDWTTPPPDPNKNNIAVLHQGLAPMVELDPQAHCHSIPPSNGMQMGSQLEPSRRVPSPPLPCAKAADMPARKERKRKRAGCGGEAASKPKVRVCRNYCKGLWTSVLMLSDRRPQQRSLPMSTMQENRKLGGRDDITPSRISIVPSSMTNTRL